MKTRYLIFIFAVITFFSAENISAQIRQDSITLQGTVLDSATKEPLQYCEVLLLNDDNTISKVITDRSGIFKINCAANIQNYELSFRFIGYKTKNISLDTSNYVIDTVLLKSTVKKLHNEKIKTIVIDGFPKNDSITLQGTVLDSATKEPLPFVNVLLLKDGKKIAGTETDTLGKYNLRTVNDEDLSILVCYISYFNKRIDNINTYKSTVIETIYMKENRNWIVRDPGGCVIPTLIEIGTPPGHYTITPYDPAFKKGH